MSDCFITNGRPSFAPIGKLEKLIHFLIFWLATMGGLLAEGLMFHKSSEIIFERIFAFTLGVLAWRFYAYFTR